MLLAAIVAGLVLNGCSHSSDDPVAYTSPSDIAEGNYLLSTVDGRAVPDSIPSCSFCSTWDLIFPDTLTISATWHFGWFLAHRKTTGTIVSRSVITGMMFPLAGSAAGLREQEYPGMVTGLVIGGITAYGADSVVVDLEVPLHISTITSGLFGFHRVQ